MNIAEYEGKVPEEVMNVLREMSCEELGPNSLEQVSGGGRVINSRATLEKVINGGDLDKLAKYDQQAADALKSGDWELFKKLATESFAFERELYRKYSSGTVVPTPDGDIILPFKD